MWRHMWPQIRGRIGVRGVPAWSPEVGLYNWLTNKLVAGNGHTIRSSGEGKIQKNQEG